MKFKKEPALSILFRILTPEEIQELTSTSRVGEKKALDLMLVEEIEANDHVHFDATHNVLQLKFAGAVDQDESDDAIEAQSIHPSKAITDAKGPALIIELKTKMQKSQGKLKTKEILDLYKKLGQQDIEQEKQNNDDLKKAVNSGILINRRQY